MKRLSCLFILSLALAACVTLPPPADRAVAEVIQTGVKPATAYDRMNAALSKRMSNPQWGIVLRDRDAARIIAKVNIECDGFSAASRAQSLYSNVNWIQTTIDFQARDGRARLAFEDVQWFVSQSKTFDPSQKKTLHGPNSKEDVSAIDAECLAPIRKELKAEILGQSSGGGDW